MCARATEKISEEKTLQELLNAKTQGLGSLRKAIFLEARGLFWKGSRMVYFPFHVCSWKLFQTRLRDSFVRLKQLVVLLPL